MRDDRIVLVLWSDGFDEMAAAAFVTAPRKLGVRVKLVSLSRSRIVGAYGLELVPDATLEQVASQVDRVRAVVVPGNAGAVRRLDDDPRVRELLCQVDAHDAVFITSADAAPELVRLLDHQGTQGTGRAVATYSDSVAAVGLAQQLAEKLIVEQFRPCQV